VQGATTRKSATFFLGIYSGWPKTERFFAALSDRGRLRKSADRKSRPTLTDWPFAAIDGRLSHQRVSRPGSAWGDLCASAPDLLARPRLLQNLYRECLKALVHAFRALIDVGDHNPDGLSHRDPVGYANVKARAAEIKYGLNNSATQTLAKRLAVFARHAVSTADYHVIGRSGVLRLSRCGLLGKQTQNRSDPDRVLLTHVAPAQFFDVGS